MKKQETFTDIEYSFRKKKTKREEFLEIMDEIIPWDEWVGVIEPYYPKGKRGRPPMGIEKMLRMYLLQIWFNLSDPATEDAIYDSYAMAIITERVIFIVILVVGIILMYNTPTAFTAGIVAVIAGLAEDRVFVSSIIIPVDTLSAAGADHGLLIGTVFAKCIVIHQDAAFQRVFLPTVTADKGLGFHINSSKYRNRPRGITPRPSMNIIYVLNVLLIRNMTI